MSEFEVRRRIALEVIRAAKADPGFVPEHVVKHFEDVFWQASVQLTAEELKNNFDEMSMSKAAQTISDAFFSGFTTGVFK